MTSKRNPANLQGERGPDALARFLGLPLAEVFPIAYDVSAIVQGAQDSVQGHVLAEPRVRLTRAELIALAVP